MKGLSVALFLSQALISLFSSDMGCISTLGGGKEWWSLKMRFHSQDILNKEKNFFFIPVRSGTVLKYVIQLGFFFFFFLDQFVLQILAILKALHNINKEIFSKE